MLADLDEKVGVLVEMAMHDLFATHCLVKSVNYDKEQVLTSKRLNGA